MSKDTPLNTWWWFTLGMVSLISFHAALSFIGILAIGIGGACIYYFLKYEEWELELLAEHKTKKKLFQESYFIRITILLFGVLSIIRLYTLYFEYPSIVDFIDSAKYENSSWGLLLGYSVFDGFFFAHTFLVPFIACLAFIFIFKQTYMVQKF